MVIRDSKSGKKKKFKYHEKTVSEGQVNLTMSIKAYCIDVVVNVKPIYQNKHVFFRVSLQLQKKTMKNYEELRRTIFSFQKVWVEKNIFPMTYSFKEQVKIVNTW